MPSLGKAIVPVSWEGYAVTVAFLLGFGLLRVEPDLVRRSIALVLLIAAYFAVVILTWDDPDAEVRPRWRDTLWNRETLVWLVVLLVLAAAFAVAGYEACAGCYHGPRPLR